MMIDGYSDICLFIAFPIARFIERKWIRFKAPGFTGKGIAVALLGLIPLGAINTYLQAPLVSLLGSHWGNFVARFIMVLFSH